MIDDQYIGVDPNIASGNPCIAGTSIKIDLVQFEHADLLLQQSIVEEGQVLYERY